MKTSDSLRYRALKQIFWDYSITPEEGERILSSAVNSPEKRSIYLKLIHSASWYSLKKILSEKELREALSAEIISRIHIPSLREKYLYVRKLLY